MPEADEFDLASDLETTKEALNRALRKLDRKQKDTDALIGAVYRAVKDAAAALHISAVPKPIKDSRRKTPETGIAVLSDWQLAKITPSYTSEICAKRVDEYADKVLELTEVQRADHPVRDLRVYLLGDLVEGEMIFPGQEHLIDASLYRQVVVDGPEILGSFVRRMLTSFDNVHVVGVIGNHGSLGGRARKSYHPESNADAMMYETTRLILQDEPRLTWASNVAPGERKWYAVDYIGEKGFFLFHGDQVKGGFGGFPWYGFGKKVMGWRMGAVAEPFDYALAGHFHTPTRMHIGNVTLWVSGSTESHNTYAAEQLAAQGTPSQWLFFCHPKRGVTAEYEVHLT